MSSDNSAYNPYVSPAPSHVPTAKVASSGRPGWYTFYCIMAIILGSLGATNALLATGGLVFGLYFQGQTVVPGNAGQDLKEMMEIQNEMNAEMQALTNRYFYHLLATYLLHMGIGAALLIGGVRALSMKSAAAKMLGTIFVVTSVFDLARLVLSIFYQMETAQIMQKHFGPMMEKAQVPIAELITQSMGYIIGAGLCIGVAWTIFKLWLYLSGWFYLNKPHVQALLKD